MTIPQIKQAQLPPASRRQVLGRIAPTSPQGAGAQAAGSSPRSATFGALLILLAVAMFTAVTNVDAVANCDPNNTANGTEDFEGYTPGALMPSPTCLTTNNPSFPPFVVASPAIGTRSLSNSNSQLVGLQFNTNACAAGVSSAVTYSFSFYFTAMPAAGGHVRLAGLGTFSGATTTAIWIDDLGNTGILVRHPTTGNENFQTMSSVADGAPAATINTWYQATISIDDSESILSTCSTGAVAVGTIILGGNTYQNAAGFGGIWPSAGDFTRQLGGGNFQQSVNSFTGAVVYFDNLQVSGYPITTASNQVAVTNLVGYSMDADGRNIVVRTNGGTTVEAYGVDDLVQTGTVSVPNCVSRNDGVNSAIYPNPNNPNTGEVYITYVDCDADGESDAFRIRSSSLGSPILADCTQATQNVDNNAQVDVPNNMGDIGTISDLPPSYLNRCNDTFRDEGSVGWSFNTITCISPMDCLGDGNGGRIGAWAVSYNDLGDDFTDEETVPIDTTAFPEIDQFCSWQGTGGRDFIGAAAFNGATGIFEVISSVVVENDEGVDVSVPDLELDQMFLNTGQYGNAFGLACAQDTIAILKSTQIHVLNNVTGIESIQSGWPKTVTSSNERGVAISGSGNFIAYVSGGVIHIVAKNGTETGTVSIPTGTWRGMEFDNSGEHLAVFTSTLITVYETGPITCETQGNCALLGGVIEEGGDTTTTSTRTGTTGPGAGGSGADFIGTPYFWTFIIIIGLILFIMFLAYISRAAASFTVYGVAAMIGYIIGILVYGPDVINPWPIVAIVVFVLGMAIIKAVKS